MKIIHELVESCYQCPYCRDESEDIFYCDIKMKDIEYIFTIPEWCPLEEVNTENA